jgi:cytochrome c oxidase cbb3-type subunit 3
MPPTFPSLIGVGQRLTNEQIATIVHNGRGRMPAVGTLPQEQLASLLVFLRGTDTATTQTAPATAAASNTTSSIASSTAAVHSSSLAEAGGSLFQQNCAFCHGRDAMGGETGPDLTRSKLVLADVDGDKISEVVHNGRPEKKMPAFNFSSQEMASVVAFIHSQQAKAQSMAGKRRGVDVADLQTGNVEAGKQYFNGAGGCAKCHSATGDLSGIAKRYEGLQLEERMLYPRDAKSRATVTTASGESVTGTVAYRDEFTIGLRDSTGAYRSWPTNKVKYTVDSPVNAHVELFSKYTDDDIHNLMAYLQTMH